MNSQQFEKIKNEIEEAKSRKDKLQGALDQLKERMTKTYGVSSLEELQKELEDTKTQLGKLQAKFDSSMKELEEMMVEIV